MRAHYLFLGTALLGMLAGCSRSAEVPPVGSGHAQWVNQDFENLFGWIAADKAASLATERAHSGKYSLRTSAEVEYSLGFGANLGQISATKPRKIQVQLWAWVPKRESTTALVVQIGNATKTVQWEGINLSSKVGRYGSWQKVETDVLLSPDITSADAISVYLWRQKETDPVYIDDLVITEAE